MAASNILKYPQTDLFKMHCIQGQILIFRSKNVQNTFWMFGAQFRSVHWPNPKKPLAVSRTLGETKLAVSHESFDTLWL